MPQWKQHRADVTMRDLENWFPGSVWASVLAHADWVDALDMSHTAKRLTRMYLTRDFQAAVESILKGIYDKRRANRTPRVVGSFATATPRSH